MALCAVRRHARWRQVLKGEVPLMCLDAPWNLTEYQLQRAAQQPHTRILSPPAEPLPGPSTSSSKHLHVAGGISSTDSSDDHGRLRVAPASCSQHTAHPIPGRPFHAQAPCDMHAAVSA